MGKLVLKRRSFRKPQVGDMRNRIVIAERDIKSPAFQSASFSQTYTKICSVWSSVETTGGNPKFSGVNTKIAITHIFTIRYRDDITSESIIEFNNNYYKIIDPDDPSNRKQFLFLMCISKGDKTLEANQ